MRLLRLILTLFTDSRQMVFDHTGRDSQGLYYENRWFCITDDKGGQSPLRRKSLKMEKPLEFQRFFVLNWYRQGESNPVAQRITICNSKK